MKISRITLKRSAKLYKTVLVEHEDDADEKEIRRRAIADNQSGEGFVKRDGERMRTDVVNIEPITRKDLPDDE